MPAAVRRFASMPTPLNPDTTMDHNVYQLNTRTRRIEGHERIRDQLKADASQLRNDAFTEFVIGADAFIRHAASHAARAANRFAARLRQHARQRAAGPAQDDPGSQPHHAQTQRFGRLRSVLPPSTQAGEKIVARGRCLRDRFIGAVTVVAHSATRHEDGWPRRGRGDRAHQQVGHLHAAVFQDRATRRRPPAAHQRLAGQIHDRVTSLDRAHEHVKPRVGRNQLDLRAELTARAGR